MSATPQELVLERELNRGGGWVVYLARLGTLVGEARIAPRDDAEGFQREVDRLHRLTHPHLPRAGRVGTHEGQSFILVDRASGPSLQNYLARHGAMPWQQVLDLARPLASALKFAHDRGLVLGEVSLDTLVFVTEPVAGNPLPAVRIACFPPPIHKPGDASVGPRGEVHGLGRVLAALLTGKEPDTIRPLAGLPRDVPGEFRVFLERVLDSQLERRPPDGNTLCKQLDKIRGSIDEPAPSESEAREAEAALVSRFVREEMEAQKQGGPVQQFFNKPWVVIPLFLLCIGTIVWTFWPMSRESMFQRGSTLMQSEDPADWSLAFSEYFDPMEAKFPDHPHRTKLMEFRNRLARTEEERAAARAARHAGPMTEAQWAYQVGLRQRQVGEEAQARATWQALIDVFGEVPGEGPWVRLARQRLADAPEVVMERKVQPLNAAKDRARLLRAQGKNEQADAIERGLKLLERP